MCVFASIPDITTKPRSNYTSHSVLNTRLHTRSLTHSEECGSHGRVYEAPEFKGGEKKNEHREKTEGKKRRLVVFRPCSSPPLLLLSLTAASTWNSTGTHTHTLTH